MKKQKRQTMRIFKSGATRDNDTQKLNYTGSLSPIVLKCFTEFMRKHNIKNGKLQRDESNWKKGMPKQSYMDSKFRHFMMTWLLHDKFIKNDKDNSKLIESLCAELFNTMGFLHVLLIKQKEK